MRFKELIGYFQFFLTSLIALALFNVNFAEWQKWTLIAGGITTFTSALYLTKREPRIADKGKV